MMKCVDSTETSYTVEPRLSDSCLSVPSIIRNDVQKFLKQVIPDYYARDPSFVV